MFAALNVEEEGTRAVEKENTREIMALKNMNRNISIEHAARFC
jgi:hypothetical protein